MTQKELKKLNRRQLLELLLLQTERADQLQKQLDEARAKLDERSIVLLESGSIAEAAMKLSGVFQAAQAAADSYVESVRHRAEQGDSVELEAAGRAQAMLEAAERRCREREQAADAYWAQTEERIRKQCQLMHELLGKELPE